jgi:hypothetical protein
MAVTARGVIAGIFLGVGAMQSISTNLYVVTHGDFAAVLTPILWCWVR